jgi:hypothetical protein
MAEASVAPSFPVSLSASRLRWSSTSGKLPRSLDPSRIVAALVDPG